MNSWPPGWRPPPWCWPPPCAAWATFPAGCVAGFCPGSPEISRKGSPNDQLQFPVLCHLEVIFWIFGRNNKQTNLLPPLIQFLLSFHCGFTNSHWCWGVRMSPFLWAVFNLACCTSFTSQGVNFGAEYPLSSCDGWENLAQLSDALCCNHQKIKRTFFAC